MGPIFASVAVALMMLHTRATRKNRPWEPTLWACFKYFFVLFTLLSYVMAFHEELWNWLHTPDGFLLEVLFTVVLFWWAVRVWQVAARRDRELLARQQEQGATSSSTGISAP